MGQYEKNDPEIFGKLLEMGDFNFAIKNAERLLKQNKGIPTVDNNPSTMVHLLAGKLMGMNKF